MIVIIPFLILLLVLFFTKNNILALIGALLSSFLVYCYVFKISVISFLGNCLPQYFFSVVSPSGYLYPLLFLLVVACIIDILKDLYILESYSALLHLMLHKMNSKVIDFCILCSPLLFFIDDYLIMFGVKSFFAPLFLNCQESKKELSFYTVNIAAGGSVLLFFSTWSSIIINQIQVMKVNIPAWANSAPINIFLASRKYFFYPIITYIFMFLYVFFKKKSVLTINTKHISQKVIWIDVFIFLLLPFSIAGNFLYQLYFCQLSLANLDVALIMLEGVLYGSFFIIFFLILYKSIGYRYLFDRIISTLLDYKKTVISLLLCWLFSKIMLACLQADLLIAIPESFHCFYPLFYFIVSLLIAFILGSEWGTLSIMIPLLVCVKDYHNLYLLLGAIVSGVIAGAQISPISNTSTTVAAIFEVDLLAAYLYRMRYSFFLICLSVLFYLIIGYIN
jgi:hypothetical protein